MLLRTVSIIGLLSFSTLAYAQDPAVNPTVDPATEPANTEAPTAGENGAPSTPEATETPPEGTAPASSEKHQRTLLGQLLAMLFQQMQMVLRQLKVKVLLLKL